MIKIIRHGKQKEYKRRFSCNNCFCFFEADKEDCEMFISPTDETTEICKCPECRSYCIGVVTSE